ncbi:PREDICTED: ring-infected erythrocyte surface antigen-like [Papilio polytes]|uniref:ring-infected erythrocyte surface antigen-like n=1 Tax=Papilio polytes TaxID=76194 RepID=UPI00067639EE|nr:PREDICTED: ring-infected erythrocyte surface antigen-like [Papilio polytes]
MISEIVDDIKDINNKDKHDLVEIFMNLMNSKNKTDLEAKDNSTVYKLVPFLTYFSISNNTEVNKNNSVDFNEETAAPIVNDFTTETSVTYKDNDYNEVNTILYELNNLVDVKQTSDSEYTNTEQTTQEIVTEIEIQTNRLNNDINKDTSNSERYTNTEQTTQEIESITEQNILNNDVPEIETSKSEIYTNTEQTTQEIELNTEQNTINDDVSKTETSKSVYTEQTTQEIETELGTEQDTINSKTTKYFSTTEAYSTTEINSEENISITTKYTESTTDDENIEIYTATEKSETTVTEKLDEYDTIVTNIDISTKLPALSNLEVTDRNVNDSTDFENIENTTNEPNAGSYDEITELIEDLENEVSETTNIEEYNYTAYSLPSSIPDKVSPSNACRQKDIIYTYIFILYVKVFVL